MSSKHTTDAEWTEAAEPQDASVLKIRISLKGRPLRTLSFTKDVISIGRDPESDVYLDNPGISRNHTRLEKTPDGFLLEDLASANGTYVNDEQVERRVLEHNDIVRIGKFSLWIAYEDERRGSTPDNTVSPSAHQGTTVLSTNELDKMMTKLKEFDDEPKSAVSTTSRASGAAWKNNWVLVAASAFVIGAVMGSVVTWIVLA